MSTTTIFVCEACPGVAALLVPLPTEEARSAVMKAGWRETSNGRWLCNNHVREASQRVATEGGASEPRRTA